MDNGNVLGRSLFHKFFSRLKTNAAVHPLEPIEPPNSEFFTIDPLRRIRVIRFPVPQDDKALFANEERCSWTEDYWFTRWTRPLTQHITEPSNAQESLTNAARCGCSFRHSQREYFRSQQRSALSAPPITDCERYIERLVSTSIAQVLGELPSIWAIFNNNGRRGVDNVAFLQDGEGEGEESCPSQHNCNSSGKAQASAAAVAPAPAGFHRAVVILYHGIGSDADVWRSVGARVASRGYRVFAADMLGHGYSSTPDRPALYTFDSLLLDALVLFDHYTTDTDKCILIGHSYGCSLVTAIARVRPERTVQLVLIAGGGPTPLAPLTPLCASASVRATAAVRPEPDGVVWRLLIVPLLFCGARRHFFYPPRGKQHGPCADVGAAAVPHHVLRYVLDGQNWPEGDAALHRRILVPTLLVHGMLDKQVTLVQQCEMERTIPRAFLELLPNAGHMAMLDNPEHLSHMILCFMDWWHR